MNRAQSWCIHEREDGLFDLTHGNRPAVSRIATRSLALQHLKLRHRPGERVYEAEKDGYRSEITRPLLRQGVIQPTPDPRRR